MSAEDYLARVRAEAAALPDVFVSAERPPPPQPGCRPRWRSDGQSGIAQPPPHVAPRARWAYSLLGAFARLQDVVLRSASADGVAPAGRADTEAWLRLCWTGSTDPPRMVTIASMDQITIAVVLKLFDAWVGPLTEMSKEDNRKAIDVSASHLHGASAANAVNTFLSGNRAHWLFAMLCGLQEFVIKLRRQHERAYRFDATFANSFRISHMLLRLCTDQYREIRLLCCDRFFANFVRIANKLQVWTLFQVMMLIVLQHSMYSLLSSHFILDKTRHSDSNWMPAKWMTSGAVVLVKVTSMKTAYKDGTVILPKPSESECKPESSLKCSGFHNCQGKSIVIGRTAYLCILGFAANVDNKGEVRLACELAVNVRLSGDLCNSKPCLVACEGSLHEKNISRHNRLPPTHIVDAAEEEIAFLAAFTGNQIAHDDPARLRERFNLQHTWHDRPVREVALEKRLVNADRLHRHRALARLERNHLVHKKERVPVRKHAHHLVHAHAGRAGHNCCRAGHRFRAQPRRCLRRAPDRLGRWSGSGGSCRVGRCIDGCAARKDCI
jgi:hypothetical protein